MNRQVPIEESLREEGRAAFWKAARQEEFTLKEVGRVLIVKPYSERCSAESCLYGEGIVPEVKVIGPSWARNEGLNGQHPEAYAGHISSMWQEGEEFINIEHDMAPWPGAIESLHECPEPLCHFRYPYWPPGYLTTGIGCFKFGQVVIDELPDAWEDWEMVYWWNLDGAILTYLRNAGFKRHEHLPSIAHVRRSMGAVIGLEG
jgi:hypothetical protein